ncbi:MAG: hypothetical protein AAGJ46_19025 [Planctomycetota bacterium]
MTRNILSLTGACALAVGLSSSAFAIQWNDIAVGTDANIGGGSVYTLKAADLSSAVDPLGGGVNPATGLGEIADVGFQTNRTPLPPNTPPNTFPGGPDKALETVVWLTTAGSAGNANANRPGDKLLNTISTGFTGVDLTVLGDDTVFLGGSGVGEGDIQASGLQASLGSPAVGDGVVDSVWQKIPSNDVAVAYISGTSGMLGVRDNDGSTVGADVMLSDLPIDVDVYRQDPTLVVATADNVLSKRDGLSLAEIGSVTVGSGELVAISVLSDRTVAVALFDGLGSVIEFYDEDLNFVSDSGTVFDSIEITAMDNQNLIDTLVIGDTQGNVTIYDSSNFSVIATENLGAGAITAITVNAPEPTAAVLAWISLAGLSLSRRRG